MEKIYVPDWGYPESRIVLVGEAPGQSEVAQGKPFVGASGMLLESWWKNVGLVRDHFYITNVYPYQPPGNKIGKIPEEELQYWAEKLRQRLSALPDPWIVVPTGNYALRALQRAVRLHSKEPKVTDWRGSILTFTDDSGREVKMVPTLHPAGVLRKKSLELRCVWDWYRIVNELQTREVVRPWREHRINPTLAEIRHYFGTLPQDAPVAVDIETHPEEGITCVGFAAAADLSFTVPFGVKRRIPTKVKKFPVTKEQKEGWKRLRIERFQAGRAEIEALLPRKKDGELKKPMVTALEKLDEGKLTPTLEKYLCLWEEEKGLPPQPQPIPRVEQQFVTVGYWRSEEEDAEARRLVAEFVAGPNPKIFQNGLYDTFWFTQYMGVAVGNWAWDTLSMHHCLSPRDEHALDYMASLYTREPFWKKEAKEAEESKQYATRREALYTYNGKDCAVTYELFTVFHKMLEEQGKLDFYDRHYRQMQEPLLQIMRTGLPYSAEAVKQTREETQGKLSVLLAEIEQEAGKPLHAKKKLSPDRLKKYLYEELRLPVKKAKRADGEKTQTANETAIRQLILQCSTAVEKRSVVPENYHKFLTIAKKILEANRLAKVVEQLLPKRFDTDGRFRSSYKFTTTTGRLASSKNPFGTGANAQNIDRELRHIFAASPGRLMMEIDLSQVEGRIVYMLTGDPMLVQMAQTHPADYDMHTAEAAAIFKVPEAQVTAKQRYLGKRTVHASQRGMMGKRLSEMLLGEDTLMTPAECQALIDAYFTGKPAIKKAYFAGVRTRIWEQRHLSSLWGRTVNFTYDRWDEELYREGYSWEPQSEAADLLNQWGLIPTHRYIQDNRLQTTICAQVHDALWFETTVEEGWWVAECFRAHIERPLHYPAGDLIVPCSLKIGRTAKGDKEWKRFPTREEFEEEARKLV